MVLFSIYFSPFKINAKAPDFIDANILGQNGKKIIAFWDGRILPSMRPHHGPKYIMLRY